MRKKLFSLLVLLMVAVTGAWATEVTIATNQQQTSYTSGDITISVPSGAGDGDGDFVSSWCPMTITCGDGNVLQSVVVTIGFYPENASDVTASAGSCEVSGDGNKHSTYVTVTGINASSVSIGCNGDVQIEQVVVNYSPSAPAVVASWVGNSAINANGTWYYAGNNFGWCTGGAFNGADLGTITTLSLGGQSQAWAEGNANWNDGNLTMTMGYKIDGGADQSLSLNWFEFADNNNKFQSGGSSWAAQDIDISGLTPGNHTIAVWFTRDDKWDSNNSANYVANFTIPTPAATTYTVTVKEGTEDADKWTITPAEATTTGVAQGTEVSLKYAGLKRVKSVKAVKKAAAPGPVTYTALSGGEVLHVGDIIEVPVGQEWRINNSYIMSSRNPLTVVRANITFDQWDDVIVTEAADGAYYVIKDTGGWYYCTYEGFTLPVTGTSDGIYVTYNGILWDEYPDYTFSVHEK